jgi:hypothetical protein
MILFGEGSLWKATHEFIEHYHHERNHQGLGNPLIMEEKAHGRRGGAIQYRQRLGGMLNHYYRRQPESGAKSRIIILPRHAVMWAQTVPGR